MKIDMKIDLRKPIYPLLGLATSSHCPPPLVRAKGGIRPFFPEAQLLPHGLSLPPTPSLSPLSLKRYHINGICCYMPLYQLVKPKSDAKRKAAIIQKRVGHILKRVNKLTADPAFPPTLLIKASKPAACRNKECHIYTGCYRVTLCSN